MEIISTKNLCFKYKNKEKLILDDISSSFKEGSINVLIGLNGSGKSTLIKIIAGILHSYTGDIIIDGKDIKTINIKERSKLLSYVPQTVSRIEDFTVLEYLLFAMVNRLSFYESPNKEDALYVKKIAANFKIEYLLDKKLGEISGGERQIVSICSAIVQDTKIVVLDEPTSALDIKNQYIVLNLIKNISKEQGKTFIISSHNPNHALYLNSNVILLKDSKIIAQGEAKEIINPKELSTIYGENICYSNNLNYQEISFNDNKNFF